MNRILSKTYLFCLLLIFLAPIGFAQDNLRIIELNAPGESAPIDIPAGYAFTFGLFAPMSNTPSNTDIVGVVAYGSPHNYTFESCISVDGWANYDGWYIGPAKVSLKGLLAGSRMQLYTIKLPAGVVSGILSNAVPNHSVAIPQNALLTSLFEFTEGRIYPNMSAVTFRHILSIKSSKGITYGYRKDDDWYQGIRAPIINGMARLEKATAQASAVGSGMYFGGQSDTWQRNDDLDAISPTEDFCGAGNATFSLITSLYPEANHKTPIAFYCYKITPVTVTIPDATPPTLVVATASSLAATTTASSYVIKGTTSDNISPTSIKYKIKTPASSAYGNWITGSLTGSGTSKNWEQSISLSSKGIWLVQFQVFDAVQNASAIKTVTLTKN